MTYQKFKEEASKLEGVDSFLVKKFVVQSLVLLITCLFAGISVVFYCFNKSMLASIVILVLLISLYSAILDFMVLSSSNFVNVYNKVHKLYPFIGLIALIIGVVFAVI